MNDWSTSAYTQIDVLRHGACEGGEIFRGSTDVVLSEQGWKQMDQSTSGLEWDHIVSSPLQRCQQFAEQLAKAQGVSLHVDERWREFDFGVWEGRLRTEVWAESGDDVVQFFTNPMSFTPEGGDSYLSVCERIDSAWGELLDTYSGKRVLLVTHGGIFRALYAQLKSLPSDAFNSLEVPYACLSRWKHYSDSRRNRAIFSFHNRQLAVD